MIDRGSGMGGSWLSLEQFGLHDVENAIHYFLPDPHAFDFMRDVLGWSVVRSVGKYRILRLPILGYRRLPYDNFFSRIIGRFAESAWDGKKRGILSRLFTAVSEVMSDVGQPSYYVSGGGPEMLRKTRKLFSASSVHVEYGAVIDRVYIDKEQRTVEVSMGSRKVVAETIFFTHGSKIANLSGPSGAFPIADKVHRRPAVHLLVRDVTPPRMLECIFVADPVIKYAHDVTRFSREAAQLAGTRKVVVLALHKHVMEDDAVYPAIFQKLQLAGLLGKDAILEDKSWVEAFLPPLDDYDLHKLKSEFGTQVEYLKTENFSRAIGYNAPRWAGKLADYAAAAAVTDCEFRGTGSHPAKACARAIS